jgi:GxxExxY protein
VSRDNPNAGLRVQRQVPLPVTYKQRVLGCGYRTEAVVESAVMVEFKTVEKLLPVQRLNCSHISNYPDWVLGC